MVSPGASMLPNPDMNGGMDFRGYFAGADQTDSPSHEQARPDTLVEDASCTTSNANIRMDRYPGRL